MKNLFYLSLIVIGITSLTFRVQAVSIFNSNDSSDLIVQTDKSDTYQKYFMLLSNLIKNSIENLDREMVVFRYEYGSNGSFRPKYIEDIESHLQNRPGRFFDTKIQDDNVMGPGLYVAIDPYSSRGFGGDQNPQLYVLHLKKNSIYINGTRPLSENESLQFQNLISDLKCNDSGSADFNYDISNVITTLRRESNNYACRKLIIDVIAQNNVDYFLYTYSGANSISGCRKNRAEAINIINFKSLIPESTNFYDSIGKFEARPITPFVHKLFIESEMDLNLKIENIGHGMNIPSSIKSGPTSLFDYVQWKNRYIFKCGGKSNIEKTSSQSSSLATLLLQSNNIEAKKAILELSRSFYEFKNKNEIKNIYYFDISQLKNVWLTLYNTSNAQADGIPIEDWIKSYELLSAYSEEPAKQFTEAAVLLKEV